MAGAPRGAWKRFTSQSGAHIGGRSIKVYICAGCETWHEGTRPAQCPYCGRLDFDKFDSKTEAKDWARLCMLQRRGKIANLRRQVPFQLLTVHERTGKPVAFAKLVADFVYDDLETGEVGVIHDSKGHAITPEAKLKLRCMEASGRTVKLSP